MFPKYHLTDSVRVHPLLRRVTIAYHKLALSGQITLANPDETIVILALAERG